MGNGDDFVGWIRLVGQQEPLTTGVKSCVMIRAFKSLKNGLLMAIVVISRSILELLA